MTADEFKKIRKDLGWSIPVCSRHILMSERNIYRMQSGEIGINSQVAKLMEIYANKGRV